MLKGFRKKNYAFIAWGGVITIFSSIWLQVQISVAFNEWFGSFYDTLPSIFKSKTPEKDLKFFWGLIYAFCYYAVAYMIIYSVAQYISSHYTFQWRIAITDYFLRFMER